MSGIHMTCTETEAPRYAIGKVRISAVTMGETLRLLDQQVQKRQSAYVCVSNMKTTLLSQKDESYCQIQNDSFLSVPDGMPLVWFARLAGVTGVERTTGPDLMIRVLEDSHINGHSHYFLGDTELTLEKMLRIIGDRYPGMATGLYNLAMVLLDKGDYEAAEAAGREALTMCRELYGNTHPEVAASLNALVVVLIAKKD